MVENISLIFHAYDCDGCCLFECGSVGYGDEKHTAFNNRLQHEHSTFCSEYIWLKIFWNMKLFHTLYIALIVCIYSILMSDKYTRRAQVFAQMLLHT